MIGFGIDEIQAEYVAEIKLRHLNREYILKRLEDVENLEKQIKELEDTLGSRRKMLAIIIKELEEVSSKYGKDRKTKLISAEENKITVEEEKVPDYPVTLFFSRDGYFKKITPQSLRMSGEQKLKDGDEIVTTIETTNAAELLFFTDRQQVYKSRANDFDDTKASVLGDFVPAKLDFDEGEKPVAMVVTSDYSGFLLFFFYNGRVAKVPLSSYVTKTNRKKLISAYSDKFELCSIMHLTDECEVLMRSTGGRMLLVSTAALAAKTTKDNGGVAVMTQKRGQRLLEAVKYSEGMLLKPHRYRTRSLPAAGSLPSAEEQGEQLKL